MPNARSRDSLAQTLRRKGWPLAAAARYLGISRQHLYDVISRPPEGQLWTCVAAGLPAFTPEIAATLPPPPKQNRVRLPRHIGFEVRDGFTCSSDNDFCREGVSGYIVEIRPEQLEIKALLRMPHAEAWLTLDTLFRYFAPNGKTYAG